MPHKQTKHHGNNDGVGKSRRPWTDPLYEAHLIERHRDDKQAWCDKVVPKKASPRCPYGKLPAGGSYYPERVLIPPASKKRVTLAPVWKK